MNCYKFPPFQPIIVGSSQKCAKPIRFMLPDNEPPASNAVTALKRVLFVDDDRTVLDAFAQTLRDASSDYEIAFTASAPEALRKLAGSEFDVIVADMHMPEMGGADLLTEVMRLYPQ